MSTYDVPGHNPTHGDRLAMGCWAEHSDGSMIFVEAVEAGTVVYSIFDVAQDPPVEYRDAMPESGFKSQFSFGGKFGDWTWHDKTPFPWDRVMQNFPSGSRRPSADAEMSAARRVAESLKLRAERIRERSSDLSPSIQRAASRVMQGIREAVQELRK